MLNNGQQKKLISLCGANIYFDVSMARFCTLRAGGRAAALAEAGKTDLVSALLDYCRRENLPWRVIGRGSNILVKDEGFPGILIRLGGELSALEGDAVSGVITAGGGCLLAELLGYCRRNGLGGLEFLAGIPGSVGGSIRMNAGAFGQSLAESLLGVKIVTSDGSQHEITREQWQSGYRSFTIEGLDMEGVIILMTKFQLAAASSEQIGAKIQNFLQLRNEKQPSSMPSAGSFFKNPENDFAGRLIEAAGLKGLRIGAAMVSPAHANFIVNVGGATATDILQLMRRVQEKVRIKTGIFLEPEVHII